MQTHSSHASVAESCFLRHQAVKPLTAVLAVAFLALLGWVGAGHIGSVAARAAQAPETPFLGVQVVSPDELVARMFSFAAGETVLVSHVLANSPAERAGLRRGDGIVAINGRSVRSTNDFAAYVSQATTDNLLKLTVVRGGLVYRLALMPAAPTGP
jgi:S1-C subfamily serine protease